MRRLSIVAVCLLGACARTAPGTSLVVSGRSNAYVTVAADRGVLAAAWAATGDGGTDVYASTSTDGGHTFAAPVRVNDIAGDAVATGEQPPRVLIRAGTIDVLWVSRRAGSAIHASRSTDGGRTFSPARTISPAGLNGIRGWESAAVADDGTVHAVWLDGRNAGAPAGPAAAGKMDTTMPRAMDMPRQSPRQDIFHAAWSGNTVVESPVAANVCFCCKTAIATHGRVVAVAWRHLFPGGVRDIAVARSTDGGATFSDPVRVSPDNWKIDACPDDGPSMAFDGRGDLHIAWPTLMTDAGGPHMAVFASVSHDDGQTFAPRERLSGRDVSASHPRLAAEGTHLAIAWDEASGIHRSIRARLDGNRPIDLDRDPAATYPALAYVSGSWVAAWSVTSDSGSAVEVAAIR